MSKMIQKYYAEIDACQTVEEVLDIWDKKWTPDDCYLNHTMGHYCWLKIEELEKMKGV